MQRVVVQDTNLLSQQKSKIYGDMERRRNLVDAAIEFGVIEEKDKSIYTFAISSLLFSLFTWGTLLFLGVFFQKIYECLIFLLFHIPLRIYAGGFHQNTRGKCYIQSLIIFLLLILGSASTIPTWFAAHWQILVFIAFAVIWFLSPVEALNKPLNFEERKHHKMVSRTILFIEVITLIGFALNNLQSALYFSLISIQIVAIQLILGLLKNKLSNGNR